MAVALVVTDAGTTGSAGGGGGGSTGGGGGGSVVVTGGSLVLEDDDEDEDEDVVVDVVVDVDVDVGRVVVLPGFVVDALMGVREVDEDDGRVVVLGVNLGDGARPPPRSAPAREDTFVVPSLDVVVAGTSLVDSGTTSTLSALVDEDEVDDVPGPCAAATWTPRSGAEPMTLTATTPAIAVTRTPAAAPRTGSRRYAGRGSRWLPTYCM